jgi:hypothetical protein
MSDAVDEPLVRAATGAVLEQWRVHDFNEKLAHGQEGEEFVRKWLSKWGDVAIVTDMETQRLGIDMYLFPRGNKDALAIEVKTDAMAAKTGRAYLETASVVTANGVEKSGWVFTCRADRLVYCVPGQEIIVILPERVQRLVKDHWAEFMFARSENKTYHSQGLLVPLQWLRDRAAYSEKL